MKILFWFSLSGIFYTYFGYPILVWMLSKLRPRRWQKEAIAPSVSVVLAVHNGASLLEAKVNRLLTLDYSNLKEVIVVSDGSTDGTAEMLTTMKHPLLKAIVLEEHSGKAAALNAGIAQAAGEILLFVDIRPEVAAGSVQKLLNNFADSTVGCVAGELILRQDNLDGTTGAITGLYWRYEKWLRTCESLVDSPVGVYGGFYAVRRELARLLPEGLILDDMFQPLSIIRQGYRSVLDSEAIVFDAWPKKIGAEFNRKVRTLAGNFQLIQLTPWILTPRNRVLFQFVSHKLARLLAPYLFLLLLLSSTTLAGHSRIFALFTLVQLAGLFLAIIGLFARVPVLSKVTSPAGALLTLNAAAVMGLYKFCFTRGPLWKIWTSSAPSRERSATELGLHQPSVRADETTSTEQSQIAHTNAEVTRG